MAAFFLVVAILLVSAKLMGHLSVRLGFPSVLGEILAGVLLSASCLDLLGWPLPQGSVIFSPEQLHGTLAALAELGVIFLMFIAGLETDLVQMRKVGLAATTSAAGGVILPFVGGALFAHWAGRSWPVSLFIGTLLTATSVSITAQSLLELRQLKSKEGSCILGAAVIDDVLGVLVLSLVAAATLDAGAGSGNWSSLWMTGLGMALYFMLAWSLGRFFEPLLNKASGLRTTQAALAAALALCLIYSWSAEAFGHVAAITGAYIAGVLFGRTSFREELTRSTEVFAYSFFVPLFLAHVGLQTRFESLEGTALFTTVLLAIAILGKIVGCGAGALAAGFGAKESMRVGVGMMSRGEVGLIIASYGLARGIIDASVFAEMVLIVLVTTLLTPIGLKLVFPRQKPQYPV
ncbi:MAG: cation:proton antiporter [Elusimicrobiota bacterium]